MSNPLDPSKNDLQRIRERAYHMWQQDGEPDNQSDEYWERARELDAMATNQVGLLPADQDPIIDEASLQENLGEFPSLQTDQGDRMTTPASQKQKNK